MAKLLWRSTLGGRSPDDHPAPSTMFDESAFATGLHLPPTLPQDIARSFRLLDVAAFRASIVDIDSLAFQAAWTISEQGEVADSPVDQPLDGSFPAATAAINLLADAPDDETLAHRLSPRRWGLAWRLDDQRVMLAEVRFHERRDAVGDADKALLRLACGAAIQPLGGHAPRDAGPIEGLAWPLPDRRPQAPIAWLAGLSLALMVIGTLLATWLAVATVPELQRAAAAHEAQRTQWRAQADRTLGRGMATALASGDYGDVQTALGGFAALGYFDAAAVVNLRQRVVALSGATDPLRIGDPVPPEVQRSAQVIELALGAERLGQLLIVPAPVAPATGGLPRHLAPLAGVIALAAAAAALTLLLAWRGRRAQAA